MTILAPSPLMTLKLDVAFDRMMDFGVGPQGRRRIAPINGGRFEGERLKGEVLPGGADWVINRPDGVMVIDVRIALKTEDDVLIYMTYQGRFLAEPEVMKRFNRGGQLEPHEYSLRVTAKFECGNPAYAWLNDTVALGVGEQTPAGPIYTFHDLG